MKTLLERHFDTAFDAPDGIKRLRELILSLAMQGKLVKQDPNDTPASELLKEIRLTRSREAAKEKGGKAKEVSPIKPEEKPYEIPKGWEWVRLEALVSKIGSGSTPRGGKHAYTNSGIPFLRSQNIWNDGLKLDDVAFILPETHKKMFGTSVMANDILLNITGASLGRSTVVPDALGSANVSQHVTIIRCVNPDQRRFLHFFILSPYCQSLIWTRQVGMAREGLSKKVLEQFEVPLPPLSEQHRIVAKIDQLMARCDALEKLRAERDQKRLVVHAAAIRQLLDPSSLPSRPQHVQHFLFSHFPELYAVKENVTELRKAILQLAVMGKLVTQDPNDPPASELLKEIEAEKKRLIKAGQIKQPKPLPPIKPEEVPYELPKGWEWVRLGMVAVFENGDRSKRYPNENDHELLGVPFFGAKDIVEGMLSFDNGLRFISEDKFKELSNGKLRNNDFVILLRGTVGKIARFRETSKFKTGFINAQMLIIRFISQEVCNYFSTYSATAVFQGLITNKTTGSAVRQMPANVLTGFLVPLPPLAEQHRIVAKIDQLMALCDAMENQITTATAKQTALLEALLKGV